jgi:hypothetical protein
MKPRHAAALALIGWYLMVLSHPEKPYWEGWTAVAPFESESVCQHVVAALQSEGFHSSAIYRVQPFADGSHKAFAAWQLENAMCMKASQLDDSQLKGN